MVMDQKVLLIFTKNPEKGQVKTRLAQTVGEEKAMAVYQRLLHLTKSVAGQVDADRQVWYSRYINHEDLWTGEEYTKHKQQGVDLGQRMKEAFRQAFAEGYQKAVIIGSDCAEIKPEMIRQAYRRLDENDTVIGPARDGGYYLLGMADYYPDLFDLERWSHSSVFTETVQRLKALGLTCHLLPELNDIDTESDLLESDLISPDEY